MSAPIQQRLDVTGYALPLRPEALAELSEFEVGHVLACLRLDVEQIAAAELAVAAVRDGTYPSGPPPPNHMEAA